jgi:hypothetical protein
MPFEAFKARVRIVKDEEVVKKWTEEQSWKTEFVCLNLPEPVRLSSREEVEKHFRQAHLGNIVKAVETHRMSGVASRGIRDHGLLRLLRFRWEEQKRFPIQVATVLSQQFASRGLQFFKVNRTVTHVAVARPHYLDLESTPVSENVQRIVDFINAHPKCNPRHLIEALAPRPALLPPPAPAGDGTASATGTGTAHAPDAAPLEATPEMAVVMADLSWLVRQGHVIEFASGILEMAKKPVAKPPKAPSVAGAGHPAASLAEAGSSIPIATAAEAPPVSEPQPGTNGTKITDDTSGEAPAVGFSPSPEQG